MLKLTTASQVMQPEVFFTVLFSVLSIIALVWTVVKKVRGLTTIESHAQTTKSLLESAKTIEASISNTPLHNVTITVTNSETKASVQLPPHYDRKAVSRFLEITA